MNNISDQNPDKDSSPIALEYRRWLWEQGTQINRRLFRFMIGGCGGGVIATLSLIGGIISQDHNAKIPSEVFRVLCIYLFGIFMCWLTALAESGEFTAQTEKSRRFFGARLHIPTLRWIQNFASTLASSALFFGTILALSYLYSRTT